MEIRAYQPDAFATELVPLLRDKYGKQRNFEYFLGGFRKAFSFCVGNENILFRPIVGYEDGKIKAHIALIRDARLPAGEAFFGFFEVPDDITIFRSMWDALLKEARKEGISILKGPVNGSIWHQYRCIKETDGSEFFKTELFCGSHYHEYLRSAVPATEFNYYSAYREKFDVVLRVAEAAYSRLATAGFLIEEKRQATLSDMQKVAEISRSVFKTSWGYVELSEKEFMQLYSSDALAAHLNRLYLLYKGSDIIGFCGTLKENDRTLICKTICIAPEYQGLGLGNALAYKIHKDACEEGIKKILYVLIREGNNIKNFPQEDIVIFRRYAAFEFHV